MRISDWSSDVCSSDLPDLLHHMPAPHLSRLADHADRGGHVQRLADQRRLIGKILTLDVGKRIFAGFADRGDDFSRHPPPEPLGLWLAAAEHQREHSAFRHDVEFLLRSEEHTSELQSLMRISYAV